MSRRRCAARAPPRSPLPRRWCLARAARRAGPRSTGELGHLRDLDLAGARRRAVAGAVPGLVTRRRRCHHHLHHHRLAAHASTPSTRALVDVALVRLAGPPAVTRGGTASNRRTTFNIDWSNKDKAQAARKVSRDVSGGGLPVAPGVTAAYHHRHHHHRRLRSPPAPTTGQPGLRHRARHRHRAARWRRRRRRTPRKWACRLRLKGPRPSPPPPPLISVRVQGRRRGTGVCRPRAAARPLKSARGRGRRAGQGALVLSSPPPDP